MWRILALNLLNHLDLVLASWFNALHIFSIYFEYIINYYINKATTHHISSSNLILSNIFIKLFYFIVCIWIILCILNCLLCIDHKILQAGLRRSIDSSGIWALMRLGVLVDRRIDGVVWRWVLNNFYIFILVTSLYK
jgi:hypothetical protein